MNRFVAAILLFVMCTGVFAQGAKPKTSLSPDKNKTAGTSKLTSAQPVDKEYTDSITKNTTDKMFLTEIVDHLPASDRVPSPMKVLGYPVGTPNKLTYTKDQ